MASSIIHYAITCELIKKRKFNNPNRLKFGAIVADAGFNGNSHMKIPVAGGHKRTYDFDGYREMFGELMKTDDLYLGYFLHLVQDMIYRHFVYDKYHWNPAIPGNVEKLHKDYAIGNYYVIQKYDLKNELIIPPNFEQESINQLCSFDLEGLSESMREYFIPFEDDDIFFFTKEMTDEYISEAVDFCLQEIDNLENGKSGINGYDNAWYNGAKPMLESAMNTRDLGMYRIAGTKEYTLAKKLLRSDRCDVLSSRDKELLLKEHITTIIDLRGQSEVSIKPSALEKNKDFHYYHFSIDEGAVPPNCLEDVPVSYMKIAEAHCMREVFKTIANATEGVLFHCTAGKDRTGVVSAILLSLAGVSKEDIIFGYTLSREFNKVRMEAYLKEHPEIDKEIVLANERSMSKFLEMFQEKYGSPKQYLLGIGLSDEEIKKIKGKLITR